MPRYKVNANDRADKDLAWVVLNLPRVPVLDFLVRHDDLGTHWELLECTIEEDTIYKRLKAEEGWESIIDPLRLGFIQEPTMDPKCSEFFDQSSFHGWSSTPSGCTHSRFFASFHSGSPKTTS